MTLGSAETDIPVDAAGASAAADRPASGWIVLHILSIIVAGAILWWSNLPARGQSLAGVFE